MALLLCSWCSSTFQTQEILQIEMCIYLRYACQDRLQRLCNSDSGHVTKKDTQHKS